MATLTPATAPEHYETISSELKLEPLEPIVYSTKEDLETNDLKSGNGFQMLEYLSGWRLHLSTLGLCLSVFLPNFEVTVVSTALVDISNGLQGFSRTSWVIVSYLAAYTGLMIVWAKLSDVVGRKNALMVSLLFFSAFSAGCGTAQTLTQLIILRAFQGLGGAGCFSVASVVVFEMIPREKYPLYTSIVSAVIALATLLGPIIGGAIAEKSTWRWVFLVNVPLGVAAMVILAIALPQQMGSRTQSGDKEGSLLRNLRRMDFLGTVLFLGASFTFVTALLETSKNSWSSPESISLLVVAGVLAITLLLWERHISLRQGLQEPIFPWSFVHNPAWLGMLTVSLLLGVPFAVLVVSIPQKFQTTANLSPLSAGLRLLPYALVAPVGGVVTNAFIARRKNFPLAYLALLGALIQTIGLALFAVYGGSKETATATQYGCQVVAGFGLGMAFSTVVVMTPLSVRPDELATATGAIVQFRQFGSTIGLSVAASILNSQLKSHLPSILPPADAAALLQSTAVIHRLPAGLRQSVLHVFVNAYKTQFRVVACVAGVEVLACLVVLKWGRQIRIHAEEELEK